MKKKHFFYFTDKTIQEKVTLKGVGLFGEDEVWEFDKIWNFNSDFYGLDTLVVQPQYWDNKFIEFINKKHIECLYLTDKSIGAFYEAELDKYEILTNLSFLKDMVYLKCLKIDALPPLFGDSILKIEDYRPIESLNKLEYIHIPDSGDFPVFVDINFSKLKQLKNVNLQFPQENKTLYRCTNLESMYIGYHDKDFIPLNKLQKLNFFTAFCDNLESFEGLDKLSSLEDIKLETTLKLKELKNLQSDTIKIFYLYTEEACKLKSLDGIEGLTSVENIALNGYKKLESIKNLSKCHTLQILTFENCKIPNDAEHLSYLQNLERITLDDCKEINSLEFVIKLPNLKYLSFGGNTKITDGNLDFLKELSHKGVEIYFNDRKHYTIKEKDVNNTNS